MLPTLLFLYVEGVLSRGIGERRVTLFQQQGDQLPGAMDAIGQGLLDIGSLGGARDQQCVGWHLCCPLLLLHHFGKGLVERLDMQQDDMHGWHQ